MTKLIAALALALAACAADVAPDAVDQPTAEPDAGFVCSCESPLDVVHLSSCTPQPDGTCTNEHSADVTVDEFFVALCPTPPAVSCTDGVYTDVCNGLVSHFRLVPSDGGSCQLAAF
jgi:hypothetical protein